MEQRTSMLQSFKSLNNPHSFVEDFFVKYPASMAQLLISEDRTYFLSISQRRGQKPVPCSAPVSRSGLKGMWCWYIVTRQLF